MATKFTSGEWSRIRQTVPYDRFGLPERRSNSIVIGTFNIRKLGAKAKRRPEIWQFFQEICQRFDLIAIQEVLDDLEGLRHLHSLLGDDYGLVVSDVTGGIFNRDDVIEGKRGNTERLAFLFNWKRIRRTELASDISYDRTDMVSRIFRGRVDYQRTWEQHIANLAKWEEKCLQAQEAGKKKPSRPAIALPAFLTYIRQPHCASFEIVPRQQAKPMRFIAVNAHLLYGTNKSERRWEFESLIDWLTIRAKNAAKMYYPNLVLLGDCNLEFEALNIQREEIDARLKALNASVLTNNQAAKANFPLLTPHPVLGEIRTNARLKQTYDQIGMFTHEPGWPAAEANDTAGQNGEDGYDYGVFNFSDLFATAFHGKRFSELTQTEQNSLIKKFEHEISDHLPAWFRLPIPGAA